MTRSAKSPRIGSQMKAAASYVAAHPGCTQQEAALAIGPNGSHRFGAAAVQRALRAGLIEDRAASKDHTAGRGYRLFTR